MPPSSCSSVVAAVADGECAGAVYLRAAGNERGHGGRLEKRGREAIFLKREEFR